MTSKTNFIKAARYILNHRRIKQADTLSMDQERPKVSFPIPNSSQDTLNSYNLPNSVQDSFLINKDFQNRPEAQRSVPKGTKYFEPGVYAINTGLLPLEFFGASGLNDTFQHGLVATIHNRKPPTSDALKLPSGQWATTFSAAKTEDNKNYPVWNAKFGPYGDHWGNGYIMDIMAQPGKRFSSYPNFDFKNLNPIYTRILTGEDEANRVSKIWEQLYSLNKDNGFGRYGLGGVTVPENNCLTATAFALANSGIPADKFPERVGNGMGITRDNIMKYKNFGISPTNNVRQNPSPPPAMYKVDAFMPPLFSWR